MGMAFSLEMTPVTQPGLESFNWEELLLECSIVPKPNEQVVIIAVLIADRLYYALERKEAQLSCYAYNLLDLYKQ